MYITHNFNLIWTSTDRRTVNIGPVPTDEVCAAFGTPNFDALNEIETDVYRQFLLRLFPELTALCHIVVMRNPYEGGIYREVEAAYYEGDENGKLAAEYIQDNAPAEWDDTARQQLANEHRALMQAHPTTAPSQAKTRRTG